MTYRDGDLHMVGFWWTERAHRLPKPQLLVDHEWEQQDRERIVHYLANGCVVTSFLGYSFCRFRCGIADSEMGSSDLTDGVWIWPEGLHHYVEMHSVKLPGVFVEHMRSQNFTGPQSFDSDSLFKNLPKEGAGLRVPYSSDLWLEWARTATNTGAA